MATIFRIGLWYDIYGNNNDSDASDQIGDCLGSCWDVASTMFTCKNRGPEKSSILRTTVMFLFLDNRNGNQRTEIFRNTLKPVQIGFSATFICKRFREECPGFKFATVRFYSRCATGIAIYK